MERTTKLIQKSMIGMTALLMLANCGKQDSQAPKENQNVQGGAQVGSKNQKPYGTWMLMRQNQNGLKLVTKLKIEAELVTVFQKCAYGNENIDLTVASSAVVTDTEIEITEEAAREEKITSTPGQLSCRASLSKGKVQYRFNGDKLVMTDSKGSSKELERAE